MPLLDSTLISWLAENVTGYRGGPNPLVLSIPVHLWSGSMSELVEALEDEADTSGVFQAVEPHRLAVADPEQVYAWFIFRLTD